MDLKVFAERLRELRLDKNLNTRQLAAEISATHASLIFWEKGERMPLADSVSKLARFFGVSSDYLMGNED